MSKLALNRDMYLQAANERKTFSQLLEELDPTPEGSKLDAFERQLKEHGIFAKSIPEKGIHASSVDAFYRTEDSKVLFPEFIARGVRAAQMSDTILPYLVGQRTLINGDSYRAFYVDKPDASKTRKKRVTEAAELPRATIKGREQAVTLFKYGIALEASYEVIRRMQVDMLQLHLNFISRQTVEDKVEDIVSVIKNGDGNNNAAQVYNLTALDTGATAGTLTAKGFLSWLMEFEEFPCDTLIASTDAFKQIVLTQFPNLSTTEIIALLKQGNTSGVRLSTPQMPGMDFTLLWSKAVTGLEVLGINRRYAIEEIMEAGSDITEADKFITRQTSVLTISENSGYSKMFKEATKVLNINA